MSVARELNFCAELRVSGESVIYSNILDPPNLIENDHIFVLFDYKVSIQQLNLN